MRIPEGYPKLPADFDYETEVLPSADGEHDLFLNVFRKRGVRPVRALLMVHGQGEHGARYQHFPHYLGDHYQLMIAVDLRGHGRSEGIRGHVEHFDEYCDDVLLAWDALAKKAGPGVQLDWFAHSMGGTITLRMLQLRPEPGISNLILSAPGVDLTVKVPLVKDLAAKVLAGIWGSLQMDTGLDPSDLSHDPAVVTAIKKDNLHHTKATSKFYLGFMEAMRDLRESDLRVPASTRVLLQLAGEDRIVSTPAAEVMFDHLKHGRKEKVVYPGFFHEIYQELGKEQVFADWISFLERGKAS
jgi:alpha-beta hydrolase superfamily lysophospholipase